MGIPHFNLQSYSPASWLHQPRKRPRVLLGYSLKSHVSINDDSGMMILMSLIDLYSITIRSAIYVVSNACNRLLSV
jgi:hypothetical protein